MPGVERELLGFDGQTQREAFAVRGRQDRGPHVDAALSAEALEKAAVLGHAALGDIHLPALCSG